MPTGWKYFPVFSLANRGLPARRWKARVPPPFPSTIINARYPFSSIADAMLGRAAKAYEPSTAKNDLAKQLFPSSSPTQNGNIQEQFKKVRQSSQSIGGFTGYTNTSNIPNTLRTKSANIKPTLKRKSVSSSTASSTAPSTFGLSSVFSRSNSFRDTPDTVAFSQDISTGSKISTQSHPAVDFDEND